MKYAIISEDISGPAYGIGTTEAAARINAVESGFRKDAGISVEITEASFLAIEAGDPDAIELITRKGTK